MMRALWWKSGQTCLARVEATGHLLTWDQFQPFNLGVPVR